MPQSVAERSGLALFSGHVEQALNAEPAFLTSSSAFLGQMQPKLCRRIVLAARQKASSPNRFRYSYSFA